MIRSVETARPANTAHVIFSYNKDWKTLSFWRDIFLYFWFFSLIGHIIELAWGPVSVLMGSRSWGSVSTIPIFAVAAPYGLGAVALLMLVYPLVKSKQLNLFWAYVWSVIITTCTEFLSALLIVAVRGDNPFWDYSDKFMNLFGFVYLTNSLLFGIISVISLWIIFPYTEKLLHRIKDNNLDRAFWLLFISYTSIQLIHWYKGW